MPASLPPAAARLTLCGSLSLHPVSIGAALHLAGYRALGLPFTYLPFKVTDIEGALRGMRALGIRGFGISMPYKQAVLPLLDRLDPVAARIGAVNTVVNEDGQLAGHNTDWLGAVRAIEEVRPLAGARVLLLGAGGAGRAIAHGVRERGASVRIANRDQARGAALAAEVGATSAPWGEVERARAYDVVINATSVGMGDGEGAAGGDGGGAGKGAGGSPVPERALGPELVVMDIVYKPIETALLRTARKAGATVVHGGRMLLHQAALQFELYTGVPAPLEAMEQALLEQIGPPIPPLEPPPA